jgi:hypothetical protein
VTGTGEMRNAYSILVRKSFRKSMTGRLKRREDGSKKNLMTGLL